MASIGLPRRAARAIAPICFVALQRPDHGGAFSDLGFPHPRNLSRYRAGASVAWKEKGVEYCPATGRRGAAAFQVLCKPEGIPFPALGIGSPHAPRPSRNLR
jgi:hypothetical protein